MNSEQDTVGDVMQGSGEIILINHPLLVQQLLRQEAPGVVAVQEEPIHVAVARLEEAELLESTHRGRLLPFERSQRDLKDISLKDIA